MSESRQSPEKLPPTFGFGNIMVHMGETGASRPTQSSPSDAPLETIEGHEEKVPSMPPIPPTPELPPKDDPTPPSCAPN